MSDVSDPTPCPAPPDAALADPQEFKLKWHKYLIYFWL